MTEQQIDIAVGRAIEKHVKGDIRHMREDFERHAKEDRAFQDRSESRWLEDKKFQDRMAPMIQVFENNKVTRMTLRDNTSTIVFYLKSISIAGSFLLGLFWFIKTFIIKPLS